MMGSSSLSSLSKCGIHNLDAAYLRLQDPSHPAQLLGSPAHRGAQQAESPCRASKSAEPATTTFHADAACNGHGSHNRGVVEAAAWLM